MDYANSLDDKGVVTRCPACHQKNRLAFARLDEKGKCGRCGKAIPFVSTPLEIGSASQFDRIVQQAPLPVLVDFWAPWCGPCRQVAPELVKVAARNSGRLLIVKVNTEALPALGQRFRVQSIPTMALFQMGREARRTTGARPWKAIERWAFGLP